MKTLMETYTEVVSEELVGIQIPREQKELNDSFRKSVIEDEIIEYSEVANGDIKILLKDGNFFTAKLQRYVEVL